MGGVGHSHPINETILVCKVIGNIHTVASVYWYVVVENMSWVCMLMGGHIVVYAGSVLHSCWGVIWCVG